MSKKSRVVCTIGPASANPETIREMIQNGLNVVRLNFSHGTHESHREVINMVRSIAAEMNTYVGILQDLCGPKIRLGMLPEEGVKLNAREQIKLCSSIQNYEQGVLPVSYPNLHEDVSIGESILLADGMIQLIVRSIEGDKVDCEIMNSGLIFSKKGVNMPSSNLSVSAFSAKDRKDFEMGLQEKVDFVALSFVRDAIDLKEIKEMINKSEHKPKLIAKIEKPQAVKNLDEILDSVDGLMVARGDLGVEVPLESVPMLQKNIISAARNKGKFVITATQMLMSMVIAPRPTRGETSDVANAVLDGTDALMLSDESASGKYPVEACTILGKIAEATEPYAKNVIQLSEIDEEHRVSRAVGRAACWMAHDLNASLIVAYTNSGYTAEAVAQFRPKCPILALTSNVATCRSLTMCWGTTAHLVEEYIDTDIMFEKAAEYAIKAGFAKTGDRIVLTAGVPVGKTGSTNLLKVMEI